MNHGIHDSTPCFKLEKTAKNINRHRTTHTNGDKKTQTQRPVQSFGRHGDTPEEDDRRQHDKPERLQQHALQMGVRLVQAGYEQLLDTGRDKPFAGCEGLSEARQRRKGGLRQDTELPRVPRLAAKQQPAYHKRICDSQRGEPLPAHPGVPGMRAQPELQLHARQHMQPREAQRDTVSVEDRRASAEKKHLYRQLLQRVSGMPERLHADEDSHCQLHSRGHILLQRVHVLLQSEP